MPPPGAAILVRDGDRAGSTQKLRATFPQRSGQFDGLDLGCRVIREIVDLQNR